MRFFLCLLFGSLSAFASGIHFVGVPTGVNDGVDYVTPYEITIDGTPRLVTCYDIFDNVNFGDDWTASILTLEQAAAGGYFAGQLDGYRRVAWLDGQRYANDAEQVGLQHAIWNVFGHVGSTPESLRFEAAADAAARNAYDGFDFSRFRFIEQVGGVVGAPGTEQAFVFETSLPGIHVEGAASPQSQASIVPEPNTFGLLAGACLGFGVLAWRRRSRRG